MPDGIWLQKGVAAGKGTRFLRKENMKVKKKETVNVEMQQVGAYGTKQKMGQEDVPLLDDGEREKTVEASSDRAQ
jgi:hypothetical protein